MFAEDQSNPLILVVEDIHETRDGIEKLLRSDGYRVAVARDERDAVEIGHRKQPDLLLVSLAGLPREVIDTARRIRTLADLGLQVPVVIFCSDEISQGEELTLDQNLHITRPDNFNQLRSLLSRLINKNPVLDILTSN